MADVLIYSGNMHGPELRHEVPVPAPDPFLYVEKNGTKHVVITSFEVDRILLPIGRIARLGDVSADFERVVSHA